jgi:hypothetical protein
MSEQVECPKCGGFKVFEEPIIQNAAYVGSGCKNQFRAAMVVIITLGFGLLSSNVRKGLMGKPHELVRKMATGYNYCCRLCGYRWTWMIGTPKPEVTARPDLIRKGAPRLAGPCHNCGFPLGDDERVCLQCGAARW